VDNARVVVTMPADPTFLRLARLAAADAGTRAGFTVEDVEDRTPSTMGPPPAGPVTNAVIFGPVFMERIGNNVQATKAGLLGAQVILARA